MLANAEIFLFINSPVQIIVVVAIALIVFGPDKLPEIAGQLGRALRELKRAGSDLQDTFKFDDNKYDTTYDPPRYDSYGNTLHDAPTATVPEEDIWHAPTADNKAYAAITSTTPPIGDFAASALSDSSAEYGVGLSNPSMRTEPVVYGVLPDVRSAANGETHTAVASSDIQVKPAEGAVPRI